ncbi:HigA family addiction module antidote protein [bacterium]|nr:HigA family addiction module antidote protein [bacterium]
MLPTHRQPTHPGKILLEEFLKPMEISQVAFAKSIGVPIQRVNTLINGKRGISAETAVLLAAQLKTTAEFWMNLQTAYDLYSAMKKLNKLAA